MAFHCSLESCRRPNLKIQKPLDLSKLSDLQILATMDEDILEEDIDYESSESVDHDASYSQIISSQVENFTPVCNKISSYLSEFGYSTVQLISSDVDAETK